MNKYLQPIKYLQLSKRVTFAVLRRIPVIRKHYRLRRRIDCVTEACSLIDVNQAEIGSQGSSERIERRLSWLGINLSRLPISSKADLYNFLADQPLQPDRYDELKQEWMRAPSDLVSCRQLLNLHELCCFRGRYTLGQIFREKARMLAIKPLEGQEFAPPISWENTIGAAIEGGECNCLAHLDRLLERAGITGEVASKWRLYLAVLNGQDISSEWVKRFDGSGFGDYLAGKSIAIVGPAPTDALDAEEIDTHDLVVRLNHSYEGKGTDPKHKGLCTDITCFNGEQSNSMMTEHDGVLSPEVTWGCFKSPSVVSSVKEKNREKYARSHVTFNQPQFHGSFNMMPIVALDLALFPADYLKIYHTDLMLTVGRQKGYYPASFNRSDDIASMQQTFRRGSIVHDPIQQYRTLNSLWRKEKITGDARFVELMEMGLDAYLCELERVYATSHADLGLNNA